VFMQSVDLLSFHFRAMPRQYFLHCFGYRISFCLFCDDDHVALAIADEMNLNET